MKAEQFLADLTAWPTEAVNDVIELLKISKDVNDVYDENGVAHHDRFPTCIRYLRYKLSDTASDSNYTYSPISRVKLVYDGGPYLTAEENSEPLSCGADLIDILHEIAIHHNLSVDQAASLSWLRPDDYPELWTCQIWKAGHTFADRDSSDEVWLPGIIYGMITTIPCYFNSLHGDAQRNMLLKGYYYADYDMRALYKRLADNDYIAPSMRSFIERL